MLTNAHRYLLTLISFVCGLSIYPLPASAVPFGSFDPRAMAMGGAGVAAGDSANAVFFNPSLLAQYQTRKHRARNSHFVFPVSSVSASQTAVDIADLARDQPEQVFSDAIATYNANPGQTTAAGVLNASRALQNDLRPIANESVFFDGLFGLVIGIGDRREGGAFVLSRRFVGDGIVNETAADEQLLADYIEALDFIVSAGASGAPHPELFDAGGNLLDQTGSLTSTATAKGLALTELGIAMSWNVELFHHTVDVGFTPKFVQGSTYEYTAVLANSQQSSASLEDPDWHFTLDVGLSKAMNDRFKVGVVVKNLLPMAFATQSGGRINIEPQLRAGAAYRSAQWGYWALDLDVLTNPAIGDGDDTRYLSLGGEWPLKRWRLRGGYKQNFAGRGGFAKWTLTAGIGYDFTAGNIDLAYIDSGPERAAALQVSSRF